MVKHDQVVFEYRWFQDQVSHYIQSSVPIADMLQVSLTGVRISFVHRHSQFSWSPSIWTP